jgi:predicted permease
MPVEILAIMAPVFICAAIGYGWARSGTPFDSGFVTSLVMNISAPCLIVGTLSSVDMPAQHFSEIALATALVLVFSLLIFTALCRLSGLSLRSFLAPLTFPNTGNMGLPLALFAFGELGLAIALGMFMLMSMTHFSLGVAILRGRSNGRGLFLSPIVYATLVSVLMVYTSTTLPLWLENTLTSLGGVSIPLMLMTLGVSLHRIKVGEILLSTWLAVARLALGLGVGLLVVWLLDLQGVMRGVIIIQSAMPAAVFSYLLAHRYQRAPEAIAGMVVISTLLGFMILPGILWVVL